MYQASRVPSAPCACFRGANPARRATAADAALSGSTRITASLPLLLVAAYWRTNLTLRQLTPLFGISKSAADRIIEHLGPLLALQPSRRFPRDTALIVDGTLLPTRAHTVAEQSKNYRYSTNHQVVIDADARLVVAIGRPVPGNRNDCKAWELSGTQEAIGRTTVIADGGYRGTAWSSRTAASATRPNCRLGKRRTMSLTARSAPASSMSSPG